MIQILLVVALLLALPTPARAIPSPDIVINIFASLGQILGLLSVTFGGIAYSIRPGKKPAPGGGSPWPLRISLALLFATGISFALYYSYTLDLKNKRLSANLMRSSTEEGKRVGDISLATLSFSDQLEHPAGLSTEAISLMIEEKKPLNIIDVREPEETEAGMISGAFHRRYPDLRENRKGLMEAGKQTVLICFSGNRSSELCEGFRKEGLDCRFMVGGYEKWIAEGRRVQGKKGSVGELRKLPFFVNNDVLLDTPEVEKLMDRKNALFVDVRYPGDFAEGHLPGAVNIPLRRMPTKEMEAALESLPKERPVIAPCYDRRGSFYASILGLRLDRMGYDFRGRYTVPHEYTASVAERAHVRAWKEQQKGSTFLGYLGKPIQWLLYKIQLKTGSFLFAILFTVFSLRLLLLPFSVKMEIDRLREEKRKPHVAQLREKLADQPQRLSRALAGLARQDGITPIYNMAGNIIQMVLLIVLFTVVGSAANKFGGDLLWMRPIFRPDPFYIMPALVSGMIFLHMILGTPNPSRSKMGLFILSSLVIFLLTFRISSALNIYLSMSIGLLILHGISVRYLYMRHEEKGERPVPKESGIMEKGGILPLREVRPGSGVGNKALKLAELINFGFPVPGGFAISDDLLSEEDFIEKNRQKLEKALSDLNAEKVAVRSSGLREDGAEMSFAGVFESLLNVTGENFFAALEEVKASLSSSRAKSYSGQAETGGIVVQKMIPAEYAGVMFTEHPGTSGSMLVEVVEGLGEALVSGLATPDSYTFGKYSLSPMFDTEPPMDLAPLLALGRKVEARYGLPQDIEWAYADGQFYLLQTRDITSDSRRIAGKKGVLERERFRILELFKERGGDEPLLRQSELSELLPHPTRLSLNMMERLWEPGGTVDLACTRIGIPYLVEENSPPYVVTAFGALYVNCPEEKRRTGKGPGLLSAFRLSRAAESIEAEFREFLPGFLNTVRIREALEPGRLSLSELVRLFGEWEREFVTEAYVQAEMINVAAEYYMRTAMGELGKRGKDPAAYLGRLPETVVHKAMGILPHIATGKRDIHDFLELFGHRAPHDFELSMPRYRGNHKEVMKMVTRASEAPAPSFSELPPFEDRLLEIAVGRARTFQVLKEEAKHHCLRLYAMLRRLLLAMDKRLSLNGGIFNLEVEEVKRLGDPSFVAKAYGLIENRRRESFFTNGDPLPAEFDAALLERFGTGLALPEEDAAATTILRGIRISGAGEGVGRVRVLTSPEELELFERGEILVTRFTDPTWTPLFSLAAGVITEVGGWLSHAAILAREMNIVGIVNVKDAVRILTTGDFVRLHEDGTVEIDKTVRRQEIRYSTDRLVTLVVEGVSRDVRLVDISRSGGGIELSPDMPPLETDTSGIALLEPEQEGVSFTVKRSMGNFLGILFDAPLSARTLSYLRQEQATLFNKNLSIKSEKGRLLTAATEFHGELNLAPLLEKISSAVTQTLEAETCAVFIHDAKTGKLWTEQGAGEDPGPLRAAAETGITGQAFTEGATLNVPDVSEAPRYDDAVDGHLTRSILCMPIEREDRILGVIQVRNKATGPFTHVDEGLLGEISAQMYSALENARLFEEAKCIRSCSEALLENISEGVVILNREGGIEKWNSSFLAIAQRTKEDVAGRQLKEFIKAFAPTEALRGETPMHLPWEVESELSVGEGPPVSVDFKTVPLFDNGTVSTGAVVLLQKR